MAYYLWVGTGPSQNLSLLSNYNNSNAAKANLGPATTMPTSADILWVTSTNKVGVVGGTVTGVCDAAVTSSGSNIYGGTFNAAVTNSSGGSIYGGGTFNAAVTNINGSSIYGGTFNAAVTNINGSSIYGGTFNAAVTINGSGSIGGGTFNATLSFDNGVTWLYSPNSPAVVPANRVLAGTSNLGVNGSLPLTDVMIRSGGSLNPADVLNVRTGAAAGGTDIGAAAGAVGQLATDVAAVAARAESISRTSPPVLGVQGTGYISAADIAADPTIARIVAAVAGDGDVPVNHNTGGADALRAMSMGLPLDGVSILAYLKTDYTAGAFTLRGQSVTGVDGRWVRPIYLDHGNTYTLAFRAAGRQVATVEVTI